MQDMHVLHIQYFCQIQGFLIRPKIFNTALPQILLLIVSQSIYLSFGQFCNKNWKKYNFFGDLRSGSRSTWARKVRSGWIRIPHPNVFQVWNFNIMSFIPNINGCIRILFKTMECFTVLVQKCVICCKVLVNTSTNKFIICFKKRYIF